VGPLTQESVPGLGSVFEIDAAGARIVHAGPHFEEAVVVRAEVPPGNKARRRAKLAFDVFVHRLRTPLVAWLPCWKEWIG
jgi:acetate kinase